VGSQQQHIFHEKGNNVDIEEGVRGGKMSTLKVGTLHTPLYHTYTSPYDPSPGYCWIGLSDCSIRIAIQFGGLDCQSSFVILIQIQNFIIILSKNSNFIVHHASKRMPSYFSLKFSNNKFISNVVS